MTTVPSAATSANPFRAGRRLFASSCVLMLATAALHTVGGFVRPDSGSPLATITEEMAAVRFPAGFGWTVSQLEVYRTIWFQVSLSVVWIGVSGLLVAAWGSGALLRRVTWLAVIMNGAVVMLSWRYHMTPPLLCFGVIELVLAAAVVRVTAD